ncbi:MAG: hypothetical protein H8E05_00120 [Bacteroidetes bacterium]|nr:hypothetical protein [Bacteroidota bacterium]
MKPVESSVKVESQGIQDTVKFGIKSSGLHHILGILRNQLYSDKILAVVREYACNAVDAMVEAGKAEQPIEVTLPTKLSPSFKVRDFGPALSEEEIHDVYAFYGESTKRNTNDQTGMLGIGSKSAFSYGDNFVINSYLGGTKYIYNAYIDESQIGQISQIGKEASTEPDGIEIVVPTKDEDVEEFKEKSKDLFEWFAVRPVIKGAEQFTYEDREILFSGTGWDWREPATNTHYHDVSRDAMVVMGNIGYPIDPYSLNLDNNDEERPLNDLLHGRLVLRADIGDVEISASREKLQYTDFTRSSLIKKLKNVQSEIIDTVGKQFKNSSSLFEAKCLYGSVFDYGSPLYALRNVLSDKIKWNGKPIDCNSFNAWVKNDDSYEDEKANCVKFTQGSVRRFNSSGRYKTEKTRHINCEKNVVVIENDQGHNRGIMGRILPLIFDEGKKPYMMKFKTAKDKKNWLKESGFDAELKKLSDLPKKPLSDYYGSTSSTGISSPKDAKLSAKCFEYDWDGAPSSLWHIKKSDHWKVADLDVEAESGVYVILDKFQVERQSDSSCPSFDDPKIIKNLKKNFEEAGLSMPKHIYAFKVGQRSKIENKDGWTSLHNWVKETLLNVIDNRNLNQAWIDLQKIDTLREEGKRYNIPNNGNMIDVLLKKDIRLNLADTSGTLATFLDRYEEMNYDKSVRGEIKAVNTIANLYDVDFTHPKDVKPTYDIQAELDDVLEKYEILSLVGRNEWSYEMNSDGEKRAKVLNYINVIDVCSTAKGDS